VEKDLPLEYMKTNEFLVRWIRGKTKIPNSTTMEEAELWLTIIKYFFLISIRSTF
jgi:hypothetical protein